MAKKKYKYAALYTLRSDGRYMGYWHDRDGNRHAMYDRDPDVLHDRIEAAESPTEPTFKEIAELWHDREWDNIRGGTKSCYEAPYKRALEAFGDRIASEITPYEIENHLKRMAAQKYAARTIKAQRTVYKLIFENAIVDKELYHFIHTNPALSAPLPKNLPKPKKREAPEDAVVKSIRQSAETAYFGLYCLFLISTGFRRGEALGIQWQDVDFQNKTISCRQSVSHRTSTATIGSTKTDAGFRVVPLLPDLERVLCRPEDAKDTDFVFYGEDPALPMPLSTYRRRWMHYCKDMGFVIDEPEERTSTQGHKYIYHNYKTTLTAHYMRHGYATMLFEAEVDELTAQKLLGHANIETTRAVYTHLRDKQKQSSIDKLRTHVAAEIA